MLLATLSHCLNRCTQAVFGIKKCSMNWPINYQIIMELSFEKRIITISVIYIDILDSREVFYKFKMLY